MHDGHGSSHGEHGSVGVLTPEVAEILGTPEYRIEGPQKVSGRARYTGDVRLPGMLWAKFLLSPYPHARILSIDTSAARSVPGVHAVLTGQDIGLRLMGRWIYDWPVLAYEKVRYVGERVAAVAAETPEAAQEAVNRIVVEWEELPAVFDAEEALRDDAPILHENPEQYWTAGRRGPLPHKNVQGYARAQKGDPDIDRIFAEAYLVVEDVYTGARQHQGYIEPRGCVVWIDENETVRVFSTCKAPFGLRAQMARTLGLPAEKIVVDSHFIGGDFGGKGTAIDEFACYYLAKATGRPIRAVMTYAEELAAGAPQHYATYYLRTAVDREGRMIAHECRAYLNNGAYGGGRPSVDTTAAGGMECLDGYYVPNTRLESYCVYTNLTPGGNMRAPGATHRGLAGEGHIDHIARELGMDPLEFRLKNAIRPGQTNLTGHLIRNPRAVEVLERLREETRWGATELPPNRGRGIAMRNRHVGQGKAELLVRLLDNAQIEVLSGAPDQGGGVLTVAKRVAAATLSVALDRVTVRYGTTEEAPLDGGVGGSRATHVVGQAARYGSLALKKQLEDLAAEVMGWPAGEVRLERDRFYAGSESAPFEEVARRIIQGGPVEAVGAYDAAEHHHEDGHDYNFYAYMMEVEVDPDTGQVRPTDVVVVADVGTVINPIAHQGQLDGGFIYGLGMAAMEELIIEDGRVTNLSLGEYKIPTQMDAPPLRTVLLEPADGPGPYGAKAVGELTNTAVPGALANAITDAVGVRITTMPITAERVHAALRERAARAQ
ncbi:MAG TPA: xanthine dehydrogenase family protein molybdopterin-binding subunit [bacterium]|nr:xanthine dehydrogenase family protein molybdopterin-binding subunit [bacterium]